MTAYNSGIMVYPLPVSRVKKRGGGMWRDGALSKEARHDVMGVKKLISVNKCFVVHKLFLELLDVGKKHPTRGQ